MTTLSAKYTFSAMAGLSLLVAVAGCSTTAATPTVEKSAAPKASSPAGSAPASGTTYKDGTYTEDGTYQSPAGLGRITVTITLGGGIVKSIDVNGHATDPTAKSYQADFDSGIAGKVVGKKIDSLNVTNVSGSSLTSGGFDEAVTKIEAAARA
ncbi:MAG TPA: hypothetical protein VGC18_05010 [Lacisediminihabitans sp.]|uniref:FMN-binding protein n=1 Tax=Lacisediminihabitans sp. TaxID=2787631 RepID=UPI002EDAABD0